MIFLSTLLLSVLITIALVPVFSTIAARWQLVDLPGGRKLHTQAVPRCGGIAMAIGAFVPVLLWNPKEPLVQGWLAGALILVAFGMVDDFRGLGAKWKFLGQIAAALIVIFWGGVKIRTLGTLAPDDFLLPGWVSIPLTLLAIVGVTNAINLADGLDGLAGGICLLIFVCIGYLGYIEGDTVNGLVALALVGAIFGFLRYNTFPATVFMGDTGSQLLGFSAVTLSLDLTQGNTALSPVLPLILLGIPVLDTLTVMGTRIARGRSPFVADKKHFHHNLMALGLRHTESVTLIYAGQTCLVVAAFLLRFHSDWLLLTGYLAFSVATIVLLSLAGRNGWHEKLVDVTVQGSPVFRYLQGLKTKGVVIRYAFPALEAGLYLLLLVICVLPAKVPVYVTYCALPFGALILATRLWKKEVGSRRPALHPVPADPGGHLRGQPGVRALGRGVPHAPVQHELRGTGVPRHRRFEAVAAARRVQEHPAGLSSSCCWPSGSRTCRNRACMCTRSAWSRPRSSSCTSASRW